MAIQLWCMHELTFIFAVNMDWVRLPLPRNQSNKSVGISWWPFGKPQVLGKVRLEMTLNTTYANSLVKPIKTSIPNDLYLSEAAFQPRTFTITIEKGNFAPKPWATIGHDDSRAQYGYRLLFDISPYPTREGLKTPLHGAVEGNIFDQMDEFVSGDLESETRWKTRVMNDVSKESWTMGEFFRWALPF